MKKLKFRVWCKDKSEWEKDRVYLTGGGTQLHDLRGIPQIVRQDSHIIQLFTGVLDSKGREVYDGDVISCVGGYDWGEGVDGCENPGVVRWDDDNLRWVVICTECRDSVDLSEFDLHEVIGNIYENPELCPGFAETKDG